MGRGALLSIKVDEDTQTAVVYVTGDPDAVMAATVWEMQCGRLEALQGKFTHIFTHPPQEAEEDVLQIIAETRSVPPAKTFKPGDTPALAAFLTIALPYLTHYTVDYAVIVGMDRKRRPT